MVHQALARTYRPKNFSELIGQDHVRLALTHALEQQRLHHAYLFTGTRGVGKTTIARILTKCLNCETGITATPCGQCDTCREINEGRYIDLIEVDAASRTKVEDTRDLLENVQYMPTRGRYKVYLIDEVHMLSGHSFNALLKTLEEPPAHVIFLLATTDPQKLPMTILSRCLQFHLKNLLPAQIVEQLEKILHLEKLSFEPAALPPLARAAKGSMRDALSLLDQAIGYCGSQITESAVRQMLGNLADLQLYPLLDALQQKNGASLLQVVAELAISGAWFEKVLEELLMILHYIAIEQVAPDALKDSQLDHEILKKYAALFTPEEIQLYYQIALIGQRDLPLAPDARLGLEMTLLRMLAFHPPGKTVATSAPVASTPAKPIAKPVATATPAHTSWEEIVAQLTLDSMTKALLAHCSLHSQDEHGIVLHLSPAHAALHNERLLKRLNDALQQHLQKNVVVKIIISEPKTATPAEQASKAQQQRHQKAMDTLTQDPALQELQQVFGVNLNPEHVVAK